MQVSQFEHHLSCKPAQIKYPTKTAFPRTRDKHASCVHENHVYMLAGKDGNAPLRDFWRFNIGTLKWEKLSYRGDAPSYLEGHTLVSYKKLLLLFGGEFGDALTGSSLWIINPDLAYIRSIVPDPGTERPSVRRHHSAVIYSGAMYVYGGYVDVRGTSAELWCYLIEDEEWEPVTVRQPVGDTPGGRYGHSAVVHNHHMWLYGGMADLVPKQDLWAYSFGAQRWERIKNKYGPPQLTGHSAAVVGSNMILFGGTTNREPVNQLWCFCFKSFKWSQIYLEDSRLSPLTFHSAVVISPAAQEATVKASSMPYLQKRLSQLHVDKNHPRPKSSPAQRSQSQSQSESQSKEALHESVSHRRIPYERSVSSQVLGVNGNPNDPILPKWDSLAQQTTNVLNVRNQGSSESLKVYPAPKENSLDKSPLLPKRTDLNFNTAEMLNRNIVNGGIDNPGISKSTEELIHENRKTHMEISEDHYGMNGECETPVVSINSDYLVDGEFLVGDNNRTSSAKKSRLDPELVIEDLEFSDCFPNKVQLPNPRPALKGFASTESLSGCGPEGIETIELEDVPGRNRSYSEHSAPMDITDSFIVNGDRNVDSSRLSGSNSQSLYDDIQERRRFGSVTSEGRCVYSVSGGVELQPLSAVQQQSEPKVRLYSKRNQRPKKSVSSERPYMLVLGGKDDSKVNFSIKPIPVWKFAFVTT